MSLQQVLQQSKKLGVVYQKGKIPYSKLRKAKYEYGGFQPENVLYLTDATMLGSAKRGLVITAEGIHGNLCGDPFHISFAAIPRLVASGKDCVELFDGFGRIQKRIYLQPGKMNRELVRVYEEARKSQYHTSTPHIQYDDGTLDSRIFEPTVSPETMQRNIDDTIFYGEHTVPRDALDCFSKRIEDMKPGDRPEI